VFAAADPARADAAVEAILADVRELREEPLSADDLAEAQAYIRGTTRRDQERSINQANELSEGIALGYYEPMETYLAHIATVTAADVQRVARTFLDPDRHTLVVVGP
jgi:zinc protease